MWQDATTDDKTPRLGQEPYSRLLLDVNTSLEFQPEWMTKMWRWLPSAKADAQSSIKFNVEVAHSTTNPNSDGNAFVDDFEAAKQLLPISQGDLVWRQASPPWQWYLGDTTVARPSDGRDTTVSKFLYYPPAWESYWFNPVDDVF